MGITFPLWSPTIGDVSPALINEALGSDSIASTSITTVGNGTLTAAGMVGGQITRTGPTSAFTDTTDTGAAIFAALGGVFQTGDTFLVRLKNLTAFAQTISAGTGVTWSAVTVVPPMSVGNYFMTMGGTQAAPTFTTAHMSTTAMWQPTASVNPKSVALSTVGAGTITAAGIASGLTLRSGSTSAFTDTTDTADAIIAAGAASVNSVGESFLYTYTNNTVAVATLTGGTGVTVSGVTVVPANSWAKYLVTYTAASTVTMVGIEQGYFPSVGTTTANSTSTVTVSNTAVTAGSAIIFTLKTANTPGAYPHILTITPGTGFTYSATASDTSVYNYTILG